MTLRATMLLEKKMFSNLFSKYRVIQVQQKHLSNKILFPFWNRLKKNLIPWTVSNGLSLKSLVPAPRRVAPAERRARHRNLPRRMHRVSKLKQTSGYHCVFLLAIHWPRPPRIKCTYESYSPGNDDLCRRQWYSVAESQPLSP